MLRRAELDKLVTRSWLIAGAAAVALALLVLLVRYATSALNARPRASS